MTLTVDCLYPYILPWRAKDGREGLDQACDAEAAGVGGIVLSERWESKELGIMMGALSQRTSRLQLVAGITHCGTRHPIVVAGMSATMQTLSGGRFVLGFGRGVPLEFKKMGIPVLNNRGMADYAAILRQLWAGETVNYRGPAGDYPERGTWQTLRKSAAAASCSDRGEDASPGWHAFRRRRTRPTANHTGCGPLRLGSPGRRRRRPVATRPV